MKAGDTVKCIKSVSGILESGLKYLINDVFFSGNLKLANVAGAHSPKLFELVADSDPLPKDWDKSPANNGGSTDYYTLPPPELLSCRIL